MYLQNHLDFTEKNLVGRKSIFIKSPEESGYFDYNSTFPR